MTTATVLLVSLFCTRLCAAAPKKDAPVFACNLKAISAADRPRYKELAGSIRGAMRDCREISNGFTFQLDSKAVTLADAAEWISMERLCCPFLTLQISASGHEPHWLLTLTGPKGVKPLLDAEFPPR